MRIHTLSDDCLIIEDKPWLLGAFLILFFLTGIIGTAGALGDEAYWTALLLFAMVLATGLAIAIFIERVWLVFDRRAGSVELRRRNMLRYRREVFRLADLSESGILVQSNEDTDRLALHLRSRAAPVPMTSYYTSGRGVRRCAEAALAWLEGGRT